MVDYLTMAALRGLSTILVIGLIALAGAWLFSEDAKSARRGWSISVKASIEPRAKEPEAVKPWPEATVTRAKP